MFGTMAMAVMMIVPRRLPVGQGCSASNKMGLARFGDYGIRFVPLGQGAGLRAEMATWSV